MTNLKAGDWVRHWNTPNLSPLQVFSIVYTHGREMIQFEQDGIMYIAENFVKVEEKKMEHPCDGCINATFNTLCDPICKLGNDKLLRGINCFRYEKIGNRKQALINTINELKSKANRINSSISNYENELKEMNTCTIGSGEAFVRFISEDGGIKMETNIKFPVLPGFSFFTQEDTNKLKRFMENL